VVIFRSSGIPTESSMDLPLCPIETARRLD
jgi:hypothetical protein